MTTEAPAAPVVAGPLRSTGHRVARALRGVRLRVVVGYVALLTLALASSAMIVRQVLIARFDHDVELELVQEAEELRRLASGVDPSTGEPFADDAAAILETFLSRSVPLEDEALFSIVDGTPQAYSPRDVPAQLLDDAALVERWSAIVEPLRLDVATDGGEARTLAVPLVVDDAAAGTLVIAWFVRDGLDAIDDTIRAIAVVAVITLLVTAALAWWLAGRVLRPVEELRSTAERISDDDLSRRIPIEGHDELARLGTTFNAMLDRLESSFASQREFLDDVAHELRTPITIARGHLELIDADDPAERRRTLELVTGELDRMSRYVDDLLVLAKAEQPDFLAVEEVDLGEVVLDVLARSEAIGDRHWRLDEAPDPGAAVALADPVRVAQALLALSTNAVQHTSPGDEIGLGLAVDGASCELWVRDTGPGVAEELREALFRRAARAPGSRRNRPEGTGLGLAIVAAIAAAHGGAARVEDADGAGARFVLTLPLLPAAAPTPEGSRT